MFSHLTDLAHKRTPVQAIGFYVAYLVFIAILLYVAGWVVGTLFATGPEDAFEYGQRTGIIVSVIANLGLALAILYKKNLIDSLHYFVLALIIGFLSFFSGTILALIPTAFLTTQPSKRHHS